MERNRAISITETRRIIARRLILRRRIQRRQIHRHRLQVNFPFEHMPDWRGGAFEKWAHSWVARNFWRVSYYFNNDSQDAVQECALLYSKCCARYGGVVDDPSWMMTLFKVSVQRRWIYLSKRSTEHGELFDLRCTDERAEAHGRSTRGHIHNEGPFNIKVAELPHEVSDVLAAVIDAPTHVLEFIFAPGIRRGHAKSNAIVNRRLRRLFGTIGNLPVDFVRRLQELSIP